MKAKHGSLSQMAWAVGAIAAMTFSVGAHAAVGLYNTGVNDSGSVLALGAIDTHYTVTPGGPTYSVNYPEGYGPGYWVPPDSISGWITPLLGAGNTASGAAGPSYLYQTTFNLTGINLATAFINGKATADNGITGILINGHSIGFANGSYSSFAPFTINSGFTSGINTLTFDVVNGGGPTGLRADFSGSSFTAAVPEPETYAMMMVGLGLMGFTVRRRRSA
jgi:hypothetical protein